MRTIGGVRIYGVTGTLTAGYSVSDLGVTITAGPYLILISHADFARMAEESVARLASLPDPIPAHCPWQQPGDFDRRAA